MTDSPRTPDGRYLVIESKAGPRLWRATNPNLPEGKRRLLVDELMKARRAVRTSKDDPVALAEARKMVDHAKHALGERGPAWWSDGEPDLNRRLIKNTPYRHWWEVLAN